MKTPRHPFLLNTRHWVREAQPRGRFLDQTGRTSYENRRELRQHLDDRWCVLIDPLWRAQE